MRGTADFRFQVAIRMRASVGTMMTTLDRSHYHAASHFTFSGAVILFVMVNSAGAIVLDCTLFGGRLNAGMCGV